MGSSVVELGPGLAAALVVLLGLGFAAGRLSGLGQHRSVLSASTRAALQLAAVSTLIVLVVRSLWASAAFALLMLAVAAVTSAGRVTGARTWGAGAVGRVVVVGVPIAAGVLPVIAVVLLGGGSALQAGAAQLLVLIGLLTAETVSVWVTTELVARGRLGSTLAYPR